MKMLHAILGSVLLTAAASALTEELEIREAPLTWRQAALSNGEDLFLELCAVCHGKDGTGDGPAATALKKGVPDLTGLAARNGGKFPRERVENSIAGESRVASHGTVEMPIWGQAFEAVRPDWKPHRRQSFAKQRIYNLTEYLATIQAE